MITSVAEFVRSFEGVRRRTLTAVARVTPALADYRPRPDEWTCGQIVQHIARAERFFVTKVTEDRFTADLDPGPTEPWEATRAQLDIVHRSELARLAAVPDAWLALAGTEPPQIYGYTVEQALAKVRSVNER